MHRRVALRATGEAWEVQGEDGRGCQLLHLARKSVRVCELALSGAGARTRAHRSSN